MGVDVDGNEYYKYKKRIDDAAEFVMYCDKYGNWMDLIKERDELKAKLEGGYDKEINSEAREFYKLTRKLCMDRGVPIVLDDEAEFVMYCDKYGDWMDLIKERDELKAKLEGGYDKEINSALDSFPSHDI